MPRTCTAFTGTHVQNPDFLQGGFMCILAAVILTLPLSLLFSV